MIGECLQKNHGKDLFVLNSQYPAVCNTAGSSPWQEGNSFNNVQNDFHRSGTELGGDKVWGLFMPKGTGLFGLSQTVTALYGQFTIHKRDFLVIFKKINLLHILLFKMQSVVTNQCIMPHN